MPGILFLVPTSGEMRVLGMRLQRFCGPEFQMEICGFGPIASGIQATRLIAERKPDRVILAGIAGALSADLMLGRAAVFQEVACYGIGAGSGDNFLTTGRLGWAHWSGPISEDNELRVEDRISLVTTADAPPGRLLLTACSASATHKDVRDKLDEFPDAVAEDMEGFSVAMACQFAGVSLTIVRGISNIAGDRDKIRWRVADALHAAADSVEELFR